MLAGVADEKEFIIITKAKDLAFHTYDMTTARRFPKRHGKLAVDLMEFAREIVIHIQDANELDVQDAGEFRERRYEQKQALSRCKDMLVFDPNWPNERTCFNGAMRGVDKVRRGSKTDDGQLEKKGPRTVHGIQTTGKRAAAVIAGAFFLGCGL